MKETFSMVMCIVLLFTLVGVASAQSVEPVKVTVDGEEVQFDVEPTIINDRVLVPIRFVLQKIGASVDWIDKTRTVKISTDKAQEKKGILVVSFGTSYPETRKITIKATEDRIAEAYPDYEVRRAFTSQIIIKILKERDNILVNNPQQALEKMKEEGFTDVIVQPLHIINGEEYNELKDILSDFNDGTFEKLELGSPVLTHTDDYTTAVEALETQLPEMKEGEAAVLMGHGTHHPANSAYACFQSTLKDNGLDNVYVGTVEGYPTFDNIVAKLKEDNINKVTLMPFMVVAGDHAQNDMAGDEEGSWKTMLEKEGFEVDIYLHGLGENTSFQDIYVKHVKHAIEGNGQEIPKPIIMQEVDEDNVVKGKKGILVMSFGTSYPETRKVTIKATEDKIAEEYPDYEVRRAFTSQMIINILKKRDGIKVDNPTEALTKMKEEGFEEVIVQPLHIMHGAEYSDVKDICNRFEDSFKKFSLGRSLLSKVDDYREGVKALKTQLPEMQEGEATVLMGHGTHHPANSTYACFESVLRTEGLDNVYVGTVEGYPTFDNVVTKLKEDNVNKVTLMPFMVVAGDHAQNDMAGDEEDSWKTMLENEGFEVEIYLHGLGENTSFQSMYVDHVKDAIDGEVE